MKTKNLIHSLFICLAFCFSSCSSDSDGDGNGNGNGNGNGTNDITSISVEISNSVECGIYVGDIISFSVKGNNNTDVTNSATISVNGTAISGNTYTTTEAGSLQVTATYEDISTSGNLNVNVAEDYAKFTKHVLIEDYTGTWCPFCPRVSYAIELTKEQTDQLAIVAIHWDDEFSAPESNSMVSTFNISGFPTVKIDRNTDWAFPEPNNVDQVVDKTLCDNSPLGLALAPTINGNTMTIDVEAKFSEDFSFNNTRLVLMVVEDGLIADQENNQSYYGGQNPIPDFVHDHVLRASLTDFTGDAISASEVTNGMYNRTFTANLPSNVADASNVSFVAFISNDDFTDSPVVINARVAHFGDDQSFEEN
ncbi:Omp28-related outer membrane protein [Winogradskyella sp.]|uniref:Omp28-related outer membrane protein n=1 Tax=Winogradskyella sp. TaxID=1883156 RepID=UPI0026354AAB|nr:Omp28-related outer membrane protein [Winogradskyella sp.]